MANEISRPHEILVVDDDPLQIAHLEFILASQGYIVRTAGDGPQAMQAVAENPPDLILLDVILPGPNGFEICRRLKTDARYRDIPVLFISSNSESADKIKGFAAGGLDYIPKPFQIEEALARVRIHLRIHELTTHLESQVRERTHQLSDINLNLQKEITERKRIEADLHDLVTTRENALQDSEAFNLSILNSISAQIAVLDPQGSILAVNDPWQKFAQENSANPGKPAPNTGIGTNYFDVCLTESATMPDAEDARLSRNGIQAVIDGRLPSFGLDYPCHSPTEKRWFSMKVTPLRNRRRDDDKNHVVVTHTEITQLKQAEQRAQQLLLENQTILHNAMVGIVLIKERRIITCNQRLLEMFGYTNEEVMGQSTEILFDSHEAFLSHGEHAYTSLSACNNFSNELIQRRKDGSLFWCAVSGRAVDPSNLTAGSIWIYADITERQQAEQQARKMFQAVEASPISIVISDCDSVIEYVNPSFTRITGYSRSEAIGNTPVLLRSEHTKPSTIEELWKVLKQQKVWRGILCNKHKNGNLIYEDTIISPILNDAGETINYVAVKEDVTERLRIEKELEDHRTHLEQLVQLRTEELSQALEAAMVADRTKDEFLANITHELRTPLNAVIGFSSLARPLASDVRQREYLDKVNIAGKTLTTIIDDLLDLSKIVAGRLDFDVSPFSLRQLVARTHSVVSFRASEKGLALIERIDENVPDILLGDPLRIEQILLNLMSNSVKFTAAGQVELRIGIETETEDRVCLSVRVRDTGIGMSEDEIALLFKPFTQADASVTRNFGGTGLGLAICKRLAVLMEGDIEVTSTKGAGSQFHVRLWLQRSDLDSVAFTNDDEDEVPHLSYQGALALVVDDQPFNRDVVRGLLSVVDVEARFAGNGQEALDILATSTEHFDLVLMDLQMPVMDGYTATRLIRDSAGFSELPVIAMTAHTMTHERNKCAEAGMNDHIGKPFSEVAFYRLLSKWIPTHKHIQRSPRVPSSIDMDNLPSFRGIDTRIGLGLLQGDVMRYRFWLKAFINEAPAAIVRLKAALAANEPDQASMEAHTLKGRMGLLAMKPLHGLASALEKAITHAEPTHTLVADLEQGVASVCAELLAGLGSADTATDDPALCSDIPTGPRPKIIEILLRALQAGDGDCDSRILACIDELAGTPWIPRLLQAQILGNNFDYAAAAKVLTCGQASNGKDT